MSEYRRNLLARGNAGVLGVDASPGHGEAEQPFGEGVHPMPDTYGVGARVRAARKARGLTLEVTAGLAGMSTPALSLYETGERPLERLSKIDALAEALGVSRAWLLGLPVEPTTTEHAVMHGSAEAIRRALMDTEIGTHPGVKPRPLTVLEHQAAQAHSTLFGGFGAAAVRSLPEVIVELHAWIVDGDEAEQATALQALILACAAACGAVKWVGHTDLTWIAADRGSHAARRLDDPTWVGFASFYVSHALAPYSRSYAHSERAIATLQPHSSADGLSMQVYGMLHLMAAFGAGVLGRADDVEAHLREATEYAARTGDRTDLDLYFGPTNLGIWRVSIAVEQGEGGRAAELARRIDARAMPSRLRQANLFADLGRGFAQEHRDREAVNALRAADSLAPEMVRTNPLVREAVTGIVSRAKRAAVSAELRAFATQLGALPS